MILRSAEIGAQPRKGCSMLLFAIPFLLMFAALVPAGVICDVSDPCELRAMGIDR